MERAKIFLGLALLYVLAFLIVEVLSLFHPYAWTYSAVIAAVTASWPYFKLCQRYPIPGVAMLCAIMLLLFNFIIGQGHEFLLIGSLVLGFIAEGLRKLFGNCRQRAGVITSYAVMSLIPFTKTCVMWIDFETAKNIFILNRLPWYKGMWLDIHYASFGRMLSFPILITMIIITIALAVISMWLLTHNWRPRTKDELMDMMDSD